MTQSSDTDRELSVLDYVFIALPIFIGLGNSSNCQIIIPNKTKKTYFPLKP